MTNVGYSGTPLAQKLGFKAGRTLLVSNAPSHYFDLLAPLPEGLIVLARGRADVDIVHLFACTRANLERDLRTALDHLAPDGMIWASWPKKASKVVTDLTEDVIRELALPLGLVDVKVCAIDQTWSGLKLVIRKALRDQSRSRSASAASSKSSPSRSSR
jgi:hypothetical protein